MKDSDSEYLRIRGLQGIAAVSKETNKYSNNIQQGFVPQGKFNVGPTSKTLAQHWTHLVVGIRPVAVWTNGIL